MPLDVITIGNATIDAFLTIDSLHSHCRLNSEEELCIKHGEKIEVDTIDFCLGGNANNVAVGLSRLGLSTALCAEVGNDEFSDRIFNALCSEKVDFRLVQRGSAPTSFAVGINFAAERTLFVQHVERGHYFKFDTVETKWMYLTSLGDEWKTPYKAALQFGSDNGVLLAFSPGGHQLKEKEEVVMNVLEKTDILLVNKEEAITISNLKYLEQSEIQRGRKISNRTNDDIKELLKEMKRLGPKVVVITDGKRGSFAIDDTGKTYNHEIIEAEVIEKTGAGDAYASGFLAATINGEPIDLAMKWGSANAAGVIGKVGAQAGLLTAEQMQTRL